MGGKKKSGKKKADGGEGRKPVGEAPTVIQIDPDLWVKIEFKLLNWKYMNFSTKVRDNSRVFALKKLLASRHGLVKDLKLCLHSFTEANELGDEMAILSDVGLKGEQQSYSIAPDGSKTLDDRYMSFTSFFIRNVFLESLHNLYNLHES